MALACGLPHAISSQDAVCLPVFYRPHTSTPSSVYTGHDGQAGPARPLLPRPRPRSPRQAAARHPPRPRPRAAAWAAPSPSLPWPRSSATPPKSGVREIMEQARLRVPRRATSCTFCVRHVHGPANHHGPECNHPWHSVAMACNACAHMAETHVQQTRTWKLLRRAAGEYGFHRGRRRVVSVHCTSSLRLDAQAPQTLRKSSNA